MTINQPLMFLEHLLCPITQKVMTDPVIAADGHTYERLAIEGWIGASRQILSPKTGEKLAHTELQPNFLVRKIIEGYKSVEPQRQQRLLAAEDLTLAIRLRQEELETLLSKQQQQLKEITVERNAAVDEIGPLVKENIRLKVRLAGTSEAEGRFMQIEDAKLRSFLMTHSQSETELQTLRQNWAANVIQRILRYRTIYAHLKAEKLALNLQTLSKKLTQTDEEQAKKIQTLQQAAAERLSQLQTVAQAELKVVGEAIVAMNREENDEQLMLLSTKRQELRRNLETKIKQLEREKKEEIARLESTHASTCLDINQHITHLKRQQETKRHNIEKRIQPIAALSVRILEQQERLIFLAKEWQNQAHHLHNYITEQTTALMTYLNP